MNSKFYPPAYPSDRPQTADDSTISSLDSAIEVVNVQAIDTALQQSHTRRIGGANSIQNQNSILEAINRFMPNSNVGAIQVMRQTFAGTIAFLAGGRGYDGAVNLSTGFSFDSETSYPVDLRLSELRVYMGTLNSLASGVLAGGAGWANGASRVIDIIKFALPSMFRSGATLGSSRIFPCGVGDTLDGFLMGGSNNAGVVTAVIDKFNHAAGTNIPTGTTLSAARVSPHNGLSSRTKGVILGGSQSPFSLPVSTIETINFATNAVTTVGSTLIYPHISHAAFGDKTSGYVCGGMLDYVTMTSDLITKYTHATDTAAPLSARLVEPKVCCDGTGSSRAGYILGGDTPSSQWLGSINIEKVLYGAVESVSRLGSQLGFKIADQGAVSDFNA